MHVPFLDGSQPVAVIKMHFVQRLGSTVAIGVPLPDAMAVGNEHFT